MKVIVVVGNKGGIGKSTKALIFAEYLAMVKKMKGAFIDLDPQGNASSSLISMVRDPAHPTGYIPNPHPEWDPNNPAEDDPEWDGISSIADIFIGRMIYAYPTWEKNLDCFPSFASLLEDAQRVLKLDVKEKVIERFKEFVSLLEQHSEYDFIMIDTNPQFGPLTNAGLGAATDVILPTELEQYGINGTEGMIEAVSQQQRRRPLDKQLKIAGILPNKFRNTTLHKKFLNDLLDIEGIKKFMLPPTGLRTIYGELVVENAKPNCVFKLPKSEVARIESERWCSHVYERVFHDRYTSILKESKEISGGH
jgi:chromosome partitioning protein